MKARRSKDGAAGTSPRARVSLASSTLAAPPPGLPVQVHVGNADVVATPAACEQVARWLGATFNTLPGAGHACPVEQPAAVAAVLAAAARQMQEPRDA